MMTTLQKKKTLIVPFLSRLELEVLMTAFTKNAHIFIEKNRNTAAAVKDLSPYIARLYSRVSSGEGLLAEAAD